MKKICFVSLSRSDYTSLRTLIRDALAAKDFNVEVIAGGSHLLERFGRSIASFQEDQIPIFKIIDFLSESDDSEIDIARAAGKAYQKFLEYFISSKPDYVFILGDRWEMLPVAEAAFLLRLPIIHHSGGDITQGALDNQIRYTLSTKSHFHLVAIEEHRQRLIRMGEESWRVVTTGEPALTVVNALAMSACDIYQSLSLKKDESFALATFHPTTFDDIPIDKQIDIFLKTLELIELPVIITAPNPDPGSRIFLEKLDAFVCQHERFKIFQNLGAKLYYAAMSKAKYMVGNSSSGIWEAPSFELPVLNMGQRQSGRVRAKNVVDTRLDLDSIKIGLLKVSNPAFKQQLSGLVNPYGHTGTNKLILNCIRQLPPVEKLLHKKLIDYV